MKSRHTFIILTCLLALSGAIIVMGQEEPSAFDDAPVLASPLPAVTINGFYTKQRIIPCPADGMKCDPPGSWLAVQCNSGDVATGGGAYLRNLSTGEILGTPYPSVPQGVGSAPSGWVASINQIEDGWALHIRATCADL